MSVTYKICVFFSSRRRHTRFDCDWISDVCSSDLEYLRWLRPYRSAAIALLALALLTTGLQMIEPLFMRFIIDRVLLKTGLDTASRLALLQLAGAAFVAVAILSNVIDALRDYRQRLLHVRVMMSLRRA